jgi:hypothetical protein
MVPARRSPKKWTPEESASLLDLKANQPAADWKYIAAAIGTGKTPTQCGTQPDEISADFFELAGEFSHLRFTL